MPFRSFKSKVGFKVRPQQTDIKVNRDFFRKEEFPFDKRYKSKSKINYDLNFKLNKYSILKIKDIGIETKIRGNFTYQSKNKTIFGQIKSKYEDKGNVKLKLKTNLDFDFLRFELFSKGINLDKSKYNIGERNFVVNKGILNLILDFISHLYKQLVRVNFLCMHYQPPRS